MSGSKHDSAWPRAAGWIEQDGTTLEEQRTALAQMVERIKFDPATGEGRMHYRVVLNGGRFRLDTAADDLGLAKPGFEWRPHGDANPGYGG